MKNMKSKVRTNGSIKSGRRAAGVRKRANRLATPKVPKRAKGNVR